jgi:hypothetical protein
MESLFPTLPLKKLDLSDVIHSTELIVREILYHISHCLVNLIDVLKSLRGHDFTISSGDDIFALIRNVICPYSSAGSLDLSTRYPVKRCTKMHEYVSHVDTMVECIIEEFRRQKVERGEAYENFPVIIERECMRMLNELQGRWWSQLMNMIRETPLYVCNQLEKTYIQTRGDLWRKSKRCREKAQSFVPLDIQLPELGCTDALVLDQEMFIPPKNSDFSMDYTRWEKEEDLDTSTSAELSDVEDSRDWDITITRRDSNASTTSVTRERASSASSMLSLNMIPSVIQNGRNSTLGSLSGRHLVVFVPGFRGTHFDFKLFSLVMSVHFDSAQRNQGDKLIYFLPSCNNVCADTIGIEYMAERLAVSLMEFLHEEEQDMHEKPIRKISFIAHSLGGLVVRSMLGFTKHDQTYCREFVRNYSSRLYTLLTLSTPHLGSLNNKKSLIVNSAMWFLRFSRGVRVLLQLNCQDSNDPDKCLLSILARDGSIALFKHIILVACPQDTFVSAHSALVVDAKSMNDNNPGFDVPTTSRSRASSISSDTGLLPRSMSERVGKTNNNFEETPTVQSDRQAMHRRSESSVSKVSKNSPTNTLTGMTADLQHNLKKVELVRCNVKFEQVETDTNTSKLDKITGKAFHTAYLSNVSFISGLISTFDQYF